MTNLEMPRAKPRAPLLAVLYRLTPFVVAIVGRRRFLKWALDLTWAMRRIAWEQSGWVIGERFHNEGMGLSEEFLAGIIKGKSVLDLGCGEGRWSRIAGSYAGRVVGLDRDASRIAVAARTAPPGVTFRVGDVSDLSDVGRFDVTLAIHLVEHIDDPVSLLRRLHDVTETLIVEVPDFESDALNLVRLWLGRPFYSDADHVREYTEGALRKHLESADWTVESIHRRGGALVGVGH